MYEELVKRIRQVAEEVCEDYDSYENVMACLMDDVSVSVLHNMGKAEEGE